MKQCSRGSPVNCGQEIRLEHITTNRNLHSHHFGSPLSNAQEVSAFGDDGEGDSGDVWTVVCEGDFWQRAEPIMFKHVATGVFLGASGHTFGRPINGQMEIVGLSMPDISTKYFIFCRFFIFECYGSTLLFQVEDCRGSLCSPI